VRKEGGEGEKSGKKIRGRWEKEREGVVGKRKGVEGKGVGMRGGKEENGN